MNPWPKVYSDGDSKRNIRTDTYFIGIETDEDEDEEEKRAAVRRDVP